MPSCLFSLVAENRSSSQNMSRCSKLLAFVSSELQNHSLTTSVEPTNFIGLAISRDRPNKSIAISQPHFVGKILDLYAVPSSTAKYPMAEDFLISLKTTLDLPILEQSPQTLIQEKIRNILYLASYSRSDTLYLTTQLSRRSNKATSKDMAATYRLLRYIASTSDLGLTFCARG